MYWHICNIDFVMTFLGRSKIIVYCFSLLVSIALNISFRGQYLFLCLFFPPSDKDSIYWFGYEMLIGNIFVWEAVIQLISLPEIQVVSRFNVIWGFFFQNTNPLLIFPSKSDIWNSILFLLKMEFYYHLCNDWCLFKMCQEFDCNLKLIRGC